MIFCKSHKEVIIVGVVIILIRRHIIGVEQCAIAT